MLALFSYKIVCNCAQLLSSHYSQGIKKFHCYDYVHCYEEIEIVLNTADRILITLITLMNSSKLAERKGDKISSFTNAQ